MRKLITICERCLKEYETTHGGVTNIEYFRPKGWATASVHGGGMPMTEMLLCADCCEDVLNHLTPSKVAPPMATCGVCGAKHPATKACTHPTLNRDPTGLSTRTDR